MNNLLPDLLDTVIRMSVTGGVLILFLLFVRKTAVNHFNAKWNYRLNILVVIFMLLPLNTGFLLRNINLPSFDIKVISEKINGNIKNTESAGYTEQTKETENIINRESIIETTDDISFDNEDKSIENTAKNKFETQLNYKYIFSLIYLSGLLLFSSKKLAGYFKFKKFLKNSSVALNDERIISLYEECAAELAIRKKISLYSNNNINSPMMSGLLKPAVYLPDLTFDADEMRLILKHELIHCKRNDLWYKLALSIVRAVHWFNPLCILFEKSVDLLCELSCDELIIENMRREERKFYCKTIINTVHRVNDRTTKPDGVYAAINSNRKQMERRFSHMLNYKKNTIVNIIISCALVACLIIFGVFASALMSNKNSPFSNSFATIPVESGDIVSIYSGTAVTGAIDSEGKVYIWGNNSFGQCDVPDGLPRIKDLGIGASCVIALDIDGKLHGWGSGEYNNMDFIGQEGTFVDVDAQSYHVAALSSDGKVFKWGDANEGGQESVPEDLPFIVSVHCNTYCTTAIDIDGQVHMWGIMSQERASFVENTKNKKAQIAAVLDYDTIILGEDGKIYGKVPHKNYNNKYEPQPEIKNIKAIFGGGVNAAAIDSDGKVYIWGEYDYNPGMSSIIDVPDSLPPIVQVAIGYDKVTALGEDGKIYEWGGASYEMLKNIDLNDLNCMTNDLSPESLSGSANVYTANELYEAVQNKVKNIYVKADVTINQDFNIENGQTLHIAENAILSVNVQNFGIYGTGDLINDGKLVVSGRIRFNKEPTKIGNASISGSRGEIMYNSDKLTLSEVKRILDGDLPYNSIASICWEKYTFVIDEDYTLEAGKIIWLNSYTTLKVAKGVTLTIEGDFTTHQTPVIEGTVIGKINVYK